MHRADVNMIDPRKPIWVIENFDHAGWHQTHSSCVTMWFDTQQTLEPTARKARGPWFPLSLVDECSFFTVAEHQAKRRCALGMNVLCGSWSIHMIGFREAWHDRQMIGRVVCTVKRGACMQHSATQPAGHWHWEQTTQNQLGWKCDMFHNVCFGTNESSWLIPVHFLGCSPSLTISHNTHTHSCTDFFVGSKNKWTTVRTPQLQWNTLRTQWKSSRWWESLNKSQTADKLSWHFNKNWIVRQAQDGWGSANLAIQRIILQTIKDDDSQQLNLSSGDLHALCLCAVMQIGSFNFHRLSLHAAVPQLVSNPFMDLCALTCSWALHDKTIQSDHTVATEIWALKKSLPFDGFWKCTARRCIVRSSIENNETSSLILTGGKLMHFNKSFVQSHLCSSQHHGHVDFQMLFFCHWPHHTTHGWQLFVILNLRHRSMIRLANSSAVTQDVSVAGGPDTLRKCCRHQEELLSAFIVLQHLICDSIQHNGLVHFCNC